MGIVCLGFMVAVELAFFVWNQRSKEGHKKQKEYVRIGIAVALFLLVLTGVLEGFARYGMLLLVLLVQLLLGAWQIWRRKEKPYRAGRAAALLLGNLFLYSLGLFAAILFPQYKEPQVTGTHEVETGKYTWTDESRVETFEDTGAKRKVTLQIWYPREEGRYPLVLFDHGAFGVIESNTSTCMELASHGYVVVSMGHPYHSMYLQDMDGKMTMVNKDFMNSVMSENGSSDAEHEREIYENSRAWMELRTGDNNFALDTILACSARGESPFDRIDAEHIGLFGHSMGGAAAQAMGRQRSDIDAVIDLEGTMFGEYVGFANGMEVYSTEAYDVPVLDVYSSSVFEQAKAMEAAIGVKYVNFDLKERAADYSTAIVEDAGHLNFTDLPLVSPILAGLLGTGDVDARECIEQVNELVLDYFETYLK